jgi:UDP-N-acetylmuramoyl-tripeptide--D-alanyl-D-alanine ligase
MPAIVVRGSAEQDCRVRLISRNWTQWIFEAKRHARLRAAPAWRSLLARSGAEVVGITGSHGKSTAAALLGRMLATRGATIVGFGRNNADDAARTILSARPRRHRYVVQEAAFGVRGSVAATARLIRPTVAVVTAIGGDHRKAVGGSRQAMAAEKAMLVEVLEPDGLAVLNIDDPLVAGMAGLSPGRTVFYGRAPEADLRLLEAVSSWPDRLTLTYAYRGERWSIRTRFVSAAGALSISAALLTALELGVDRATCTKIIESFEPLDNRMSVHRGRRGEWYVLDAQKASYHGIEACIGFLETARAPRKTVIFGTISDHAGADRGPYNKATRMALAHADRVFFTGPQAMRPRRLAAAEFPGRVFMDEDPAAVLARIGEDAVEGELIYVKASAVDRLGPRIKSVLIDDE